jgi:hypothetical protein
LAVGEHDLAHLALPLKKKQSTWQEWSVYTTYQYIVPFLLGALPAVAITDRWGDIFVLNDVVESFPGQTKGRHSR